jgi:RNA polymerase sigma-70 factor (ECF subfamily)
VTGGGGPGSPAEHDERLIAAFEIGRPGAGAELYDRLLPVVDATLYRVLGRREQDHADLVQSAFEQIVVTLARRTYGRACSLSGWAAVIACHVGLNAIRARRRERVVVDHGREIDASAALDLGAAPHPEGQLWARRDLDAVRRHLAEMDRDRATAVLLHAQGYDIAEIARLTKVSVAAAQSRLSRGRREIRARLAADGRAGGPRRAT